MSVLKRSRKRGTVYGAVIGFVVGVLFAGLAFPLASGLDTVRAADPGSGPLPDVVAPEAPSGSAGGPTAGPSLPGGGPLAGPSTVGGPAPGQPSAVPGQSQGGPATTVRLTASDQGVTASTIKVGVVLLDLSALTPLGLGLANYELSTQQQAVETYINEINAAGGLHGRKIKLVFAALDPLDSSGERSPGAVCRKMAKDEKVFTVLGWSGDAGTCAAVQFGIPMIFDGTTLRGNYVKSRNFIIGPSPTMERIAANWAGWLHDSGVINGKKLGMISTGTTPEKETADALEGTLKQLGHQVTYRARLNDQSQTPLEVQKMKAAGVNTVLLPTNFVIALQFVQYADGQNWFPQYLTSDIGVLANDGLVRNMTRGFDKAIGITASHNGIYEVRSGEKEPANARSCRERYNRANGGKDFTWGDVQPVQTACMFVGIFRQAGQAAGPQLTRQGLVSAVQRLGPIALPTRYGGSFGPGKTDYADVARPVRWHYDCRCFRTIPGWGPVRARY